MERQGDRSVKNVRRPKNRAWWKRQHRQREALKAKIVQRERPTLSKESIRELDELLRDLGGEGG